MHRRAAPRSFSLRGSCVGEDELGAAEEQLKAERLIRQLQKMPEE